MWLINNKWYINKIKILQMEIPQTMLSSMAMACLDTTVEIEWKTGRW